MTLTLSLGEKFVPGSDEKHLCQPSGVAVASDGSIYVSDGYCNSRIVKYSADGQFVQAWGERSAGSRIASSLSHYFHLENHRKECSV